MATADLRLYEQSDERRRFRVHQPQPLNRIKKVCDQQGVSVRTAARRMGLDSKTVRAQQDETADLTLSQLMQWQQILDVPLVDLVCEPSSALSQPIEQRAKLVRVMKTAMSICDETKDSPLHRLATMMIEQMVEMMPELEDVSPWHSVGQRRSLDEVGRIAERPYSGKSLFANGQFDE